MMPTPPMLESSSAPAPAISGVLLVAAVAACAVSWSADADAQEARPADLAGVWSTNSLDTLRNPAWDLMGLLSCRCATETYEYLHGLLYDPANDHMSAENIILALEAHTLDVIDGKLTDTGRAVGTAFDLADDPAIQCERFPTFRTVLHSDPIELEFHEDRILIRGEDLTIDRTVYIDGRSHPPSGAVTPEGHSIGWFEDGALVIETVGVTPGLVDDQLRLHSSERARSVERYTLSADGKQLTVDFTLYDPVMLEEPLTIRRPRVLTPNVSLDRRPCEEIAGQF
jgi:hypothetical protein